jgi:hypothetical protein
MLKTEDGRVRCEYFLLCNCVPQEGLERKCTNTNPWRGIEDDLEKLKCQHPTRGVQRRDDEKSCPG